jgi:hypothetical protein
MGRNLLDQSNSPSLHEYVIASQLQGLLEAIVPDMPNGQPMFSRLECTLMKSHRVRTGIGQLCCACEIHPLMSDQAGLALLNRRDNKVCLYAVVLGTCPLIPEHNK